MTEINWTPVVEFISGLSPWVSTILMILGTLIVIGTVIDKIIPDDKDHGFMKYALGIPILGSFLSFLTRFSPLVPNPKNETPK